MAQLIPKMNTSLVGFLDILGFQDRLGNVSSDEDLLRVYADIRSIHKNFEKDSKSANIRNSQAVTKTKIISLSDALVVSRDLNSEYAQVVGLIDTIHDSLSEMAYCHALCVMKGYFLRGGIAMGYYYMNKSRDILISDAMARSYDTESKLAYFPIFALHDSLYEFIITHKDPNGYSAKDSNILDLIAETTHPKTNKTIYYLDYFGTAICMFNEWHSNRDLQAYKAESDEKKKKLVMEDSYTRSQLVFVKAHRDAIKAELAKDHDPEKVMPKYLWLKEYHNSSVAKHGFDTKYKI